MPETIYTIGHSNHELSTFMKLLKLHGITAVADVRSSPYSRYAPHFSKDSLSDYLREDDVKYVFLGRELGARASDPSCYENGRVSYDRLAATALFGRGIDRVVDGAESERVVVMCAEKDPLDCHRTFLVAGALAARGLPVAHILDDGSTETLDESMLRLLDRAGEQPELFASTAEQIATAVQRQVERIAYVDDDLARAGGQRSG
ncbi:MAG: DUF488 domain-containing protein [Hyphomicrobiales bacterium]|nr:DUF488 domain-containing protein [Hyphomicrobiales bacterium]